MRDEDRVWAELLHLAQLSTLSLAQMTLRIIEDPSLATVEARDELLKMINELEYGVARFEEYFV